MINKTLLFWLLISLLLPLAPVKAQGDELGWLLGQINALRASVGLPGYALNNSLNSAALAHSQWMATTGMIDHTEADGSTPGSRAAAHGYGGSWVSENIYGGSMGTAAIAWNFWINSPVHYAGITNPDKNEVGIGVYNGYYTLLFGRGSGVNVPPAPPPAQEEASADSSQEEAPPAQAPAANNPVQAAAPTQAPPRPTRPPITYTPSATIASMTPTLTWTPTFTWTPSPTVTLQPPTGTPIILPSAAVMQLAALSSSPTDLAPTWTTVALTPAPTEVAAATLTVTIVSAAENAVSTEVAILETPVLLPALAVKPVAVQAQDDGFNWRLVLPVLVIGQVVLIGAVGWWLFGRSSHR